LYPKIDERKLKELATAKGKLLKKYLEAGAHLRRLRRRIEVGTFDRHVLAAHRALSTHSKERPQNLADAQ
jgi:hypothetical protein